MPVRGWVILRHASKARFLRRRRDECTRNLTRSREYDISVVELVVDAEGKGSGTAMPAVQVELDQETGDISLINLNTSPIQLTNVRKTK